jgi:hypothetical protein
MYIVYCILCIYSVGIYCIEDVSRGQYMVVMAGWTRRNTIIIIFLQAETQRACPKRQCAGDGEMLPDMV